MRNLDLSGAKNIRDFGGIVNKDGKRIRRGCFLRGNALCSLSTSDVNVLVHGCGLGTVIDLRTKTEVEEKPDRAMFGVENIQIPLVSESTAGISHEKDIDKKAMLENLPDMKTLYKSIVTDEYSVSQLKRVFEIITQNETGRSVLWHCTEGKDRCGITSALFLSLLDVDRETIYRDYLFTNNAYSANAKKYYYLVLLMSKSKSKADEIKKIFSAEAEYLNAAFSAIEENYSSVDEFLRTALGISDEAKAKMKARYLE